jgi:NAD-dependent dihydropyrimidine dehydrogenase PreA subunit
MTYIIAKDCVDVMDGACVDVCPVDCIYSKPGDRQLFINPEECIDCAACEPVCPVNAIFPEDQTPDDQKEFIKLNYEYDYSASEPGKNV